MINKLILIVLSLLLSLCLEAVLGEGVQQSDKYVHTDFDDLRGAIETSAQKFLHMRGLKPIDVPIEIDVILIGFDGSGAYQYQFDPDKLLNMLRTAFPLRRPVDRNSEKPLLSQYFIKYKVIQVKDTSSTSVSMQNSDIKMIESVIAANLRYRKANSGKIYYPSFSNNVSDVRIYSTEAQVIEHAIDTVVERVFNEKVPTKGASLIPDWHTKNAIVIINPSKRRILNTMTGGEVQEMSKPFDIKDWDSGIFDTSKIFNEEGNYVYYYQYNNAGQCTSWISSKSYMVIDVSAGPIRFGPGVSSSGSVTFNALPRILNILYTGATALSLYRPTGIDKQLFANLGEVRDTMFRGKLAATIVSAIQHLFLPDVWVDNAIDMRRVVVPLMVIRNHNDFNPLVQGEKYSINTTEIHDQVFRLLGGRDKIVMTQSLHSLHKHKPLAAALYKALYTKSESFTSNAQGGSTSGISSNLRTFIDGQILLDEFEHAEDILVSGTVGDIENAEFNTHHQVQTNKNIYITRVMPVFVLSLKEMPFNLGFENNELYVADNRAVIVLQTVGKVHNSEVEARYTGHFYDHSPVISSSIKVDRHIVAGLSTALSGLTPPQELYDATKREPVTNDWMWATGNTPFGPYSDTTSLSLLTIETAHRNAFLAKLEKMLRSLKVPLEKVEEFSSEYLSHPFESLDIKRKETVIHKSKLDVMYKKVEGKTDPPLPDSVIQYLESSLDRIEKQILTLCSDLYASKFLEVDSSLRIMGQMICGFESRINFDLRNAKRSLECCKIIYGKLPDDDIAFNGSNSTVLYVAVGFGLMCIICIVIFSWGLIFNSKSEGPLLAMINKR